MNKYQKSVARNVPTMPIAPEWIGATVSTFRGNGEVVRAFHNVNNGITLKVRYANGSGYTFTDQVTVI